jgi:hypothetical protein
MHQDQSYRLVVRYLATYSPHLPLFYKEEVGSSRFLEGELMLTVPVTCLELERKERVIVVVWRMHLGFVIHAAA